ncbi:hypothetical protein CDD81_6312 [Ophiocordyceps australis]|uniref:ZZ-type domain-containing protein n=1 Tax=Ophiocordyceps australis TaxID=1399860 RepID=A0A2C5Y302_9HYPO|nr:hypothetical protein CDD81_6312 [Ophiocordyceps australis]
MWPPTTSSMSSDTLLRPRVAAVMVAAAACLSFGYYYGFSQGSWEMFTNSLFGSATRLHRSNATRRPRRLRRDAALRAMSASSSSSSDEGEDIENQPNISSQDLDNLMDINMGDWWLDPPNEYASSQRAGHNIVNLLFRVSEDNAKRNGYIHRGCQCNACGAVPIRGVRYRCSNCSDFDLCETCEAHAMHHKTHIFYKIRVPAPPFGPRQIQPVWYTGDPSPSASNLSRQLITRFSAITSFERPELEAFWEQWTFMANTEWREDPDELYLAMDRKTFERCLVPTGGSRHTPPNLIHDRMFAFYDTNNDGLIGFGEFLQGLTYRKRQDKLNKIFEGYDIDSDGLVSRLDFLRMFRAYYVLYKQMHKDILDGLQDQIIASVEAQHLVASRQPISALFGRDSSLPRADRPRPLVGKTMHLDGSIEVEESFRQPTVADKPDTASRNEILTSLFAYGVQNLSHRRLILGRDFDSNWRSINRLAGLDDERNRAYIMSVLDPPSNLDQLASTLSGNNDGNRHNTPEGDEVDDESDEQGGVSLSQTSASAVDRRNSSTTSARLGRRPPDGQGRTYDPERARRELARHRLHQRWSRRDFYLDVEEGGEPPEDWNNDEDILAQVMQAAQDVATAAQPCSTETQTAPQSRPQTEGVHYNNVTAPSAISPLDNGPEQSTAFEIPDAERDAGKEILYQVTQQAFNELLDIIFQEAEELAFEAAETKDIRERYRAQIEALDSSGTQEGNVEAPASSGVFMDEGLEQERGEAEAGEHHQTFVSLDSVDVVETSSQQDRFGFQDGEEYRDPTMPQFRPNITPEPAPMNEAQHHEAESNQPSDKTLRRWKMISDAESRAIDRGGWGRLNFEEFQAIYKTQEEQGNHLDYLGSWIEFCIP